MHTAPEITEYTDTYRDKLIAFMGKCLPENGRRLDIEGSHSVFRDVKKHYTVFWCMFDDEEMVGTAAVKRLDDKSCELKCMYLLRKYQGRGLGKRLINTAVGYARQNGYEKMYLDTMSTSTRAIGLYRKTGFVETERYNRNMNADVFMVLEL